MRRLGGIVAALVLFGAAPLVAQCLYCFGKNKVQSQAFDFHIIQTEHFEVYYYPAERSAALDGARIAERWYARLSRVLHHQFQGRKPIIFYASQSDFQQTNIVDATGEGLGGVTEFFKHRMVLPFTGAYEELEHVVGHEMVHQFQYDVFSRGRIGAGIQTYVNINPPLWFMEGMAEYLSVGPIDNHTAMWLRDAAVEGHLPTLQELSYDEVFPYYFGHAIWAYIGEKWGDEAVGQILQASTSAGVEGAFKRVIGVTLDELISGWRDAVQTTYLPQLADHYRARRIAQPLLTRKRSEGTLHIAPALTPDGRQIAYFSEKNSFFVDLYLADAETGKVLRRLVKSTLSSNYESLRFINSAGSWSPDGRYFAIAAKRRDRDDLVILDVKKDQEVRRIPLPLNGLTTPSWSPDSKELVFTGYDGGISDLFVVNADGSGLHRLTNDKYADLQPSWAPDGKTIAFATDRGGKTDFDGLTFGNMRIALFHLDNGKIDLLGHMDQGKNIDPAWAPDGKSLAFVSDRSGSSPQTADSGAGPAPVSIKALLDSSPALPDTTEFTFKDYHTRYTPDYIARPTVGYARDNFGRGFFGGTAISLSDILGNHTMVFSGAVNGRLSEAQVLAAYINQAHRLNWAFGGSQEPLYFYLPTVGQQFQNTGGGTDSILVTNQLIRFVVRDVFTQGYYPFNRFTRLEVGGHFANISLDTLKQNVVYYSPALGGGGAYYPPETVSGGSISYYGPQVALVHDDALFGFVGPFAGSRSRFELEPTFGTWQFNGVSADWRRYFFARPFTLAVRGLFFGRFGRDADLFPQFLGSTELLRGYTAGSILNNDCLNPNTSSGGLTGCSTLDQLIGSKIAVFNAELRFPLTRSLVLGFLPIGLPPIEGALFYDMGLAWYGTSCNGTIGSCVVWNRGSQDPEVYRAPVRSWGGSIRMNFLGFVVLRFDITKPLNRPDHPNAYWTVSLGPTF